MPVRARLRRLAAAPLLLAALAAAPLVLAGCDNELGAGPEGSGVLAVLAGDPDYAQLYALVEDSDLAATLAGDGPFTVFAPDDVAFLYLGDDTRTLLLGDDNGPLLDRVLRLHVVPGRYALADLTDGLVLEALDGTPLPVRREGETVFVGDARVTGEAAEAENGLVFPISTVLRANLDLEERLSLTPITADFRGLLDRAGLTGLLSGEGPVTVFAAVDDAFDQLGTGTVALLYTPANADVVGTVANTHVVEGEVDLGALPPGSTVETRGGVALTVTSENGVYYVNGHRVLSPPVHTTNGVFYLVDSVILDGLDLDQRFRITAALAAFNTRARRYPDLVQRLSGEDDYTVFAFTDLGYQSLPSGVPQALDFEANAPLLERVLEVHLVPGRYYRDDLADGQTLVTVEGTPLTVQRQGTTVRVGTPTVIRTLTPTANQEATNGVVHYLDGVLFPETDVFDTAILRGLVEYSQAVRRAGLEGTLRSTNPITVFGFINAFFDANPSLIFRSDLDDILLYHATAEAIPMLSVGQVITPIVGPDRLVSLINVNGTDVFHLDSLVAVGPLAPATNGYVYYADGVLTVPFQARRR